MSLVGHRLKITGNPAISIGIQFRTETAGDLLLHLSHSEVSLGTIVGEGNMRVLGKEQHGSLVFLETLPEIMGIGLGQLPPFGAGPGWNRRQLFFATGEDIAVALLSVGIVTLAQTLVLRVGHVEAGLLQQTLHVACTSTLQ